MTVDEWNEKYDPGQKVSVLLDTWPFRNLYIVRTETETGAFLDDFDRPIVAVKGLDNAVELWRVTPIAEIETEQVTA